MKKLKVFLGLLVCAFMVVPFTGAKASNDVSNYEELKAAMENGGVYNLTEDITIDEPLKSGKDVTINGNDHVIKPVEDADTKWPGPNKTLITSELTGTITLNGVVLEGSPKYGVQAYNGGHVVLNRVVIRNSGYGAVSINGGTVTIKSLVMENNSYGIEFGIGKGVTGVPTLVMDGTLEAKDQKDPIHVDTDQITKDKTIAIENTEDTLQTIDLDGVNLVVKDASGNELYRSDELAEGTTVEVSNPEVEQPTTPENPEEEKPEEVKDEVENPKTSDGIMIAFGLLAVSIVTGFIAKKKLS